MMRVSGGLRPDAGPLRTYFRPAGVGDQNLVSSPPSFGYYLRYAEPWSDSLTANPGQRLTVPDSPTALTALCFSDSLTARI